VADSIYIESFTTMSRGWRRHDHTGRQAPLGHSNAYRDDTSRTKSASYLYPSGSKHAVNNSKPVGLQHDSRSVFPFNSRARPDISGSKVYTTSAVVDPVIHDFNPLSSSKTPWLQSQSRDKRFTQTMVPAMSTAHPTSIPKARTPPAGHFYEKDGNLYPLTSAGLNR
jgi:hypothetical protein